jgi:hypothetical protein
MFTRLAEPMKKCPPQVVANRMGQNVQVRAKVTTLSTTAREKVNKSAEGVGFEPTTTVRGFSVRTT